MLKNLVNAGLFQLGWFACVLGGNSLWLLLAAGALLVHLLFISRSLAEVRLVVVVCVLGSTVDSLLLNADVFAFKQPGIVIPFWLMLLWALLAITLTHCLAWTSACCFAGRHRWTAVVLRRATSGRGAISSGPVADAGRVEPVVGRVVCGPCSSCRQATSGCAAIVNPAPAF